MATVKQHFILFLKNNNAYGKFMIECLKRKTKIYKVLNDLDPFVYVVSSTSAPLYSLMTLWEEKLQKRKKSLFVQFLESNSIKSKFEEALYKQHKVKLAFYLVNKHDHFIGDAFSWSLTPEGFKFWNDVTNKWQSYMKNRNCSNSTW